MKCPNCGKRGSGSFCTGCGAQFKVKADKRFWQTGWFAVLALVVFFPLGLYCMWRHTQWGKPVKIVVTALALAWMMLCGTAGEAQDPAAGQLVPVQESSLEAPAEPEPVEEELAVEEEPAEAPAEAGEGESQPQQPAEQEPQPADEASVPPSEAAAEVPPAAEPEPVPTPVPQAEPEPVEQADPEPEQIPTETAQQTADPPAQSSTPAAEGSDENIPYSENYHGHVYRTPTGECYHYENPCGKGTYYEISWDQIGSLRPCGKCVLH